MWGEKEEEAEAILTVLTTGVALVKTEICSILNPPPQPSAFKMVPGLLDMGRFWGRNGVGGGADSRVWGYFNVLTTSTNNECALMSGGQHSRSEDLVEVAPVPWKGCPGKTVHGTD